MRIITLRMVVDGLLLLVVVAGTPAGQLMLRQGLYNGGELRGLEELYTPIYLTLVIMGFILYLMSMLAGLTLVWRYPLSQIYPVTVSVTILAAAGLTLVYTNYTISRFEFVGAALIVGGLFLLSGPHKTSSFRANNSPGEDIR